MHRPAAVRSDQPKHLLTSFLDGTPADAAKRLVWCATDTYFVLCQSPFKKKKIIYFLNLPRSSPLVLAVYLRVFFGAGTRWRLPSVSHQEVFDERSSRPISVTVGTADTQINLASLKYRPKIASRLNQALSVTCLMSLSLFNMYLIHLATENILEITFISFNCVVLAYNKYILSLRSICISFCVWFLSLIWQLLHKKQTKLLHC